MTSSTLIHEAREHRLRRVLAACLTLLLAAIALVAVPSAARADTPGINIDILHNGVVIGDDAVIPEGDRFLLRVQYDAAEDIAGKVITITLPDNVSIDAALPGNEAIESAVVENGTVTVTFKDPLPADVTEGAFAIELRADSVDGDQEAPISWSIGDDQGGVTIIVEDQVEPPTEVEDGYNKGVNPNNLDGFVQRGDAPDYAFLGLAPAIEEAVLTYTLVLNSADARSGYSIEDELAAGLGFVPGSFAATLDGEDYDFTPTVTGGSFSGTVDVPAQSSLRITYQVQVTDRAALEALLQEQFDNRNDAPGNYEILLPNDAVFGGEHERSASVRVRGNIPGVGVGDNFAKSGNWSLRNVITDEGGTLEQPAEMTYTLRANLTPWDERNANFTLQRNVVISDALLDQASWVTGDAEFIAVSGDGPIQSLTEAAGFDGTAAGFADDQYVGQYAVVGQTLLVNIGRDNTTNVSIRVKAQLDTIAGLTGSDNTTVVDGTHYPWNNRAQFFYQDGAPANRDHNAGVVDLPDDRDGGINDSAVFTKSGPGGEVRVSPGETADVPYRFSIDTSKEGIDPLHARIVDEINTEIFDISDPAAIPVTGSYGGQALGAGHFALSADDDGNLVIELSEAGRSLVGGLAEGQQWTIDIVLTTVPFDGKETFEIYNRATLYGTGDDPDYWNDDESEATSYGDEAEMRKRVYDAETGEWVAALDARTEDGEFVDDVFVYSIELIARGNYGSAFPVTIFTRNDVLPDAVEFLGFVELGADGAPVADAPSDGPDDMNGNVVATYDDGVVTISQAPGTSLDPTQGRIVTYFAVRATDADEEIVNTIAGSDATITPYGEPSVDIEKWSDEGSAPEYDESGALLNDGFDGDFDDAPGKPLRAGEPRPISFTVSNDGNEDLVDIVVSDRLTDGAGEIQDLVCVFPDDSTGTEWDGPFAIGTQFDCAGTLPALEVGDVHADTARVDAIGIRSEIPVDDADDWNAYVPVPSVDIEKWSDEGSAPEYDESGALLNDGFDGDFDDAPGKPLRAGEPLPISFTVSNDGEEPLVDVVVSDRLTDGVGEIQDLVCVFPDESTGAEWDGPFAVGTQFDCAGTLPALEAGDVHSDTASVDGVGIFSGVAVDDEDDWNAYVPVPSVDIEKWSDEGSAPEYDESGALLNDGFDGDFDEGPGKELAAGEALEIRFTVSNDGDEDLVDVVVSDRLTDGVGEIQDLVCVFPDESTGTEWDGPFAVGAQFDCTGTLPGLPAGSVHADTASVTAEGTSSGIGVDDADDWNAFVPETAPVVPETDDGTAIVPGGDEGDLPFTGGEISRAAILAALALLVIGGGVLLYSRRRTTEV